MFSVDSRYHHVKYRFHLYGTEIDNIVLKYSGLATGGQNNENILKELNMLDVGNSDIIVSFYFKCGLHLTRKATKSILTINTALFN